jgi:hypothetical protein
MTLTPGCIIDVSQKDQDQGNNRHNDKELSGFLLLIQVPALLSLCRHWNCVLNLSKITRRSNNKKTICIGAAL